MSWENRDTMSIYFVGEHLSQEYVGLVEKEEGIVDVYFAKTKIQRLNLKK